MPPRRARAAVDAHTAAPAFAAPSLVSLPDDVLIKCLQPLSLAER